MPAGSFERNGKLAACAHCGGSEFHQTRLLRRNWARFGRLLQLTCVRCGHVDFFTR